MWYQMRPGLTYDGFCDPSVHIPDEILFLKYQESWTIPNTLKEIPYTLGSGMNLSAKGSSSDTA